MAYDQNLAERIQRSLSDKRPVAKKMFGGIGYLLRGNMVCGVLGDRLIVRVGPQNYDHCLQRPHTRVFDTTGRPMAGWVQVDSAGIQSDKALQDWISLALSFTETLPAK